MARKREDISVETDLNLAPIMNMVVILIPLLLLSVVFLEVGVINITAPKLAMGAPSDTPPPDTPPLNLTVAVSDKGFRIAATGAVLPEMSGCPVPGPTICLAEQGVDVAKEIVDARQAFAGGDFAAGEAALARAMKAYDWSGLYNELVRIKNQYKDETIINVSADPDIPYAFIVRLMDASRFKLEKDSYSKSSDFWAAPYAKGATTYEELFPDPVLSLAQ